MSADHQSRVGVGVIPNQGWGPVCQGWVHVRAALLGYLLQSWSPSLGP